MTFVETVAQKYDLPIGNFFRGRRQHPPHHPLRPSRRSALRRARLAAEEILERCIALGGTVSGEHGIGIEKQVSGPPLHPGRSRRHVGSQTVLRPRRTAHPGKVFPKSYVPSPPPPARNGHHGPLTLDQLVAHRRDRRHRCRLSCAPRSIDLRTVRHCARNRRLARLGGRGIGADETGKRTTWPLSPGVGARDNWAIRRNAYDLALHTGRLDAILAHHPADLTLAVQAGARWPPPTKSSPRKDSTCHGCAAARSRHWAASWRPVHLLRGCAGRLTAPCAT
ncbi:MAG: FAD-linked oxidase C-terminal domain-containing protein [Caldilineaceae bacterium]